jgi:molybdopterin-guanine dinucleotide biosynthesis protein A
VSLIHEGGVITASKLPPVTGIVLAGGQGLRLGRLKALESVVSGQTLLARSVSAILPLCTEVVVVTRREQLKSLAMVKLDARLVVDLFPDRGSLGGLYTGLKTTANSHALVVACDMPLLNINLLSHLVELSPGSDVVLPRLKGLVEPLHAVYSVKCIPTIDQLFKRGLFQILRIYDIHKPKYVDQDVIAKYDPQLMSFFNINTKADLEQARTFLRWQELGSQSPETKRE